MIVTFSKSFEKRFQKLPQHIQKKVSIRIRQFQIHPFDPGLNNHPLHGMFVDHRSINITGDYRAVYREISKDIFEFVSVGTHAQLYE